MNNNMLYLWLTIIVVLSIAEAATLNIVTAWFVVGAIAATIANLFGAPEQIQFILFIVVSILCVLLLRPLAIKALKDKIPEKFNKDALINKLGIVETDIKNGMTGEVKLGGKVYRARAEDSQEVCSGSKVEILSIKGITLTVKKVEE